MPADSSKRTIGQTGLGGIACGAIDVVGADEVRYEGAPGRGGSDDGGGTKEGGSLSMNCSATGAQPSTIVAICAAVGAQTHQHSRGAARCPAEREPCKGCLHLPVRRCDLWGATLTLGGKVQLVTSSSQPLLVVAPISGDTPIGTQPVVVSNAADASAPASVEVLARLKIDSANSASLVKTHVQSRAEFRERLTRALHYRWAHCQQRQQLRGERDPDHLHADRGRFLHGQREPTRGRYLRQPRRVGGVGFVGSN